jgi:hypothetical protein
VTANKVYGDRVDGTYLGVDETHAHINMPAAIMWAHGLDDRPASLTFEQPEGMRWQVATQLHAGPSPLEFTAPNLQYLMDSPAEFGPIAVRQFAVDGRTFRLAVHHTGTDADLDVFAKDVERIVRQEGAVLFAEYRSTSLARTRFSRTICPMRASTAWSIATAPSSRRRRRLPAAGARCSTRLPTSSSIAGTSSASGRRGSSPSISIARTSPANCGSPKGSRSITGRWSCSVPAWPTSDQPRQRSRGSSMP